MSEFQVPDTETVRRVYANSMDPRGFDEWLKARDAEIRAELLSPDFKRIAQKRFRHEGMCVFDRQTGLLAPCGQIKVAAKLTRDLNGGYVGTSEVRWIEDPEKPKQ